MTKINHLPNRAVVNTDLDKECLDIDRWENDGGRSVSILFSHY